MSLLREVTEVIIKFMDHIRLTKNNKSKILSSYVNCSEVRAENANARISASIDPEAIKPTRIKFVAKVESQTQPSIQIISYSDNLYHNVFVSS